MSRFATPQGTLSRKVRFPDIPYNSLADTGLVVSQAGFGTYRVALGVETHYIALEKALLSGINLIDTSANYADGKSEELVGVVLKDLEKNKRLSRDEIVVVTKAGYIQGENYGRSLEKKRAGAPYPDLVELEEGLEHCIHPEFLNDQISRSLARLKMDAIDVFLLHNPEYYLTWAYRQGMDSATAHEEYYSRILKAFSYLETEVEKGRIRYYGISSNTFPAEPESPEATSLEAILDRIARIIPESHFKVIQFPLNLIETGAVTGAHTSKGESLVSVARRSGIATLINRPLNAIRNGRLVRLSDFQGTGSVSKEQIESDIDTLKSRERELTELLSFSPDKNARLQRLFLIGHLMEQHWERFQGYEHWKDGVNHYFLMRLEEGLKEMGPAETLSPELNNWLQSYLQWIMAVVKTISIYYKSLSNTRSKPIKSAFLAADTDWQSSSRLSHMAIRAIRSTEGITSVLVGMREPAYVDDVLAELKAPVSQKDRQNSWLALTRVQ